jgi:phosphoribosylformylglycinamidine (FGAM) synthase PurS component
MSERTIAIRLKIPDNEAYTALTALRGLDVAVERLERSEIWRVEDSGDPATLAARVETNEAIFNPNKHRLTVLASNAPQPGEAWVYELPVTGGDDPIARLTMGGKTIPGISRARRYVGWRLFDGQRAPVARRTLESALERLLCNPAIEKALY